MAAKRTAPLIAEPTELERLRAELERLAAERDEARAERDESEAQKAAIAEVLQVINSSPGDLAPVFDAMLEKATRLCGSASGHLATWDGECFEAVAVHGGMGGIPLGVRVRPIAGSGSILDRVVQGEAVIHVTDVFADPAYASPYFREQVDVGGIRTSLFVALQREGALLGVVGIYRRETRPFSSREIALVQSFAAQAVIAMENARLITETREALEQQTATAEVLGVINSSPGDLAPVFDAMLERAMRLCEAAFGILWTYDGELFHAVATRGAPAAFANTLREPTPVADSATLGDLVRGQAFVHVTDMADPDAYHAGSPLRRAIVDLGLARTGLVVPLRKDNDLLGAFVIYRREVRPFSDKQIALLQNFAAQAVIAMENARLITETREALEQQTATAEVLGVINSSPGDLAPVWAAMLERAMHLCDAAFGFMHTYDGKDVHPVAMRGIPAAFAEFAADPKHQPGPGGATPRLAAGARFVHVADLMEEEAYRSGDPYRRALVELGGARALLAVPLRKDGVMLGQIVIYRTEPRLYADKQVALLENFAAQAVIAMENARLLGELRARTGDLQESLEYQTAISDVLKVISGSTFDLQPVLDTVVDTAARLCKAEKAALYRLEDEGYRFAAGVSNEPDFERIERATAFYPGEGTAVGRVALHRGVVHIADTLADPDYGFKDETQIGRIRSILAVPLRREGAVIGVVALARERVEPFAEKQIELVTTFADQAVIAIENARLFTELNERTRDLQESLEYQTATSDVLQVISRSTFDLQPILDTLVETAARLCNADMALVFRPDGDSYRVQANHGFPAEFETFLRSHPLRIDRGSATGRAALERRAVHIADITADPEYTLTESSSLAQVRTNLGIPLLREGEPIGVFTLSRHRVEPFSERQIELVRTFADQAVIAIENTRLLTELRESLEQQQAMAEVLQVINSSPGNLAPVFEAMLDKAMRLCGAAIGQLATWDGESFDTVATQGAAVAVGTSVRPKPGYILDRAARGEVVVHVTDVFSDAAYAGSPYFREMVDVGGVRVCLCVAMRRENALLGAIVIYSRERPFSDQQITLLQSFAAQAVIAMDNARLLDEIRQRQAELRVTFDNMGDGVAMFDADLKLAAWNRNFQQIIELPDEFLAGRPSFADYVRALAERREFGDVDVGAEVARRLATFDEAAHFEHIRPDGRIIEVRRNPVPGGGRVLIYSDVTERKRAEAEIRAARDAAEKALGELQTAQASLVQVQKMAALGQLTAGIAHEIKNPLNFVNNFASLSTELLGELKEEVAPALDGLADDRRAEIDETIDMLTGNLDKIVEHGQRADNIVKSMLEHSRGVSGERRAVDLNALVDEALNLAYHGARAQDASFNITLERDYAPALAPIELAPQEMTRVFLNLIGNGFYATDKRAKMDSSNGYRPTLSVATREAEDGVEVRVRDNGTGIPAEIRDKLFQPFFTTKPTGEGTGLGLSISYDIVTQQHGGTIEVASEEGAYTEFTIRLPRQ